MMTRSPVWGLVIAAAAILAITMGIRQSLGLFVSPLNTATGLGIVTVSLALAVGQFVWGVAQPFFGALADRTGPFTVVVLGALLIALGLAVTPFMQSGTGLIVALGIVSAAGMGAGSISLLVAGTAHRIDAERRSMAAGLINAGGSFGQFVFAPLSQALIVAIGWVGALWALAGAALATIPLALGLRERQAHAPSPRAEGTLREQLRLAAGNGSYWLLHAGFFTCGFHLAFLVTHLPQEIGLCGLPASVSAASLAIIGLANIAGSIGSGWLGGRHRMKFLLFWVYGTRALAVALYLAAPKTETTFYVFAAALGLTWLSTVPPTAGLVGKLFGTRYLATLFGLTLLSHQVGGFFGAYLGGLAIDATGSYQWMWYADIALAAMAAVVNLPIREDRVRTVAPA